jgi:hypothetical protein
VKKTTETTKNTSKKPAAKSTPSKIGKRNSRGGATLEDHLEKTPLVPVEEDS